MEVLKFNIQIKGKLSLWVHFWFWLLFCCMVNILAHVRAEYIERPDSCIWRHSLIIFIYFSCSTEYTVVFLFFTPNPVKLFLRDNQCSHTSPLQLINETPLILLLSAFFICLVCLVCLILACPLLFFLLSISSHSSKWGSPLFCR